MTTTPPQTALRVASTSSPASAALIALAMPEAPEPTMNAAHSTVCASGVFALSWRIIDRRAPGCNGGEGPMVACSRGGGAPPVAPSTAAYGLASSRKLLRMSLRNSNPYLKSPSNSKAALRMSARTSSAVEGIRAPFDKNKSADLPRDAEAFIAYWQRRAAAIPR